MRVSWICRWGDSAVSYQRATVGLSRQRSLTVSQHISGGGRNTPAVLATLPLLPPVTLAATKLIFGAIYSRQPISG
jgi:hypothetical protein